MREKQEIFTMLGGRVKMRRGIYNPTADAAWLAAFVGDKKFTNILDVGVGSGGVALCIMAHNPNANILGIDTSDAMLAACADNAALNQHNITLLRADIYSWHTDKTFDLVVTNPPYFRGTPASHNAHHNADIDRWVRRCVARVRPRGTFATIVDASVVADVINAMSNSCGEIVILPLYGAHNDMMAERVLIRGRVGLRAGTRIMRGMNMNDPMVLRDGLTIADTLGTVG